MLGIQYLSSNCQQNCQNDLISRMTNIPSQEEVPNKYLFLTYNSACSQSLLVLTSILKRLYITYNCSFNLYFLLFCIHFYYVALQNLFQMWKIPRKHLGPKFYSNSINYVWNRGEKSRNVIQSLCICLKKTFVVKICMYMKNGRLLFC